MGMVTQQGRKNRECRVRDHTDHPREALVLGDIADVKWLNGVFDILCIHVVYLTDITISGEKSTRQIALGLRRLNDTQHKIHINQTENHTMINSSS